MFIKIDNTAAILLVLGALLVVGLVVYPETTASLLDQGVSLLEGLYNAITNAAEP